MEPVQPDARLANYRLERLLGTGGMGSVYLARDLTLGRHVAIKFIAPEAAGDERARRRLIREARAAAALDHPNICTVHDVTVDGSGRACIVMQYVEGESLAERLARGVLEPRDALAIASDLASALAAAHARGVLHRDLKPQNVIITKQGRAKLLDFGIAKLAISGPDDETQTGSTTREAVLGTPGYMSPEQIGRRPLDGRTDLFSLGAVLYECLTGRRAFKGGSAAETCVQVLHVDPTPPSSIRPGVPPLVDDVCRRLLAKDQGDRFQSAEAVVDTLRAVSAELERSPSHTAEGPVQAGPDGIRPRGSSRKLTVLACVVIAAAIGVWRFDRATWSPPVSPEARRWYARGTEAIRDGAYHTARLALREATALAPHYMQAHARLAEALAELDETGAAQAALLAIERPETARLRLTQEEQLRLQAVRALIRRDMPAAVKAYEALAVQRPGEAGTWLDLGRAQESAGFMRDALASYERALALDRQYAAAHLRRATLLDDEGRRDEALQELAEAERLYRLSANVEGETAVLLRRGALLNVKGSLTEARAALERAATLASGLKNRFQEIRAQQQLSSVTASEGHVEDAEKLASAAADAALLEGYEVLAADGLIQLASVLSVARRRDEATALLDNAVRIAGKIGARRTETRAKILQASVLLQYRRNADAIALATETLAHARAAGYVSYELAALAVISRAHDALQQYDRASALAQRALALAESVKDDTQTALALENLAGSLAATGAFPQALAHLERVERIYRALKRLSGLPFALTNRAELLIALGQHAQAERPLDELERGAADGIDSYEGRRRRARVLRALNATFLLRFDDAARYAREAVEMSAADENTRKDSTARLAQALLRHADARRGINAPAAEPPGRDRPPSSKLERELRLWRVSELLARQRASEALDAATQALDLPEARLSPEYEWRLAALATVAARRSGSEQQAPRLAQRAHAALRRLRAAWDDQAGRAPRAARADDWREYWQRADLVRLREEAGLTGSF